MNQPALNRTVKNFFQTSTLHGFKYLVSRLYADRLLWVVCCIASASCAGVLCTVLWERFVHLPALLARWDITDYNTKFEPVPEIAVCQPLEAVAYEFLDHLAKESVDKTRISSTFTNAIRGLPTNESQMNYLENLFRVNHVSLYEVLHRYTPECKNLIIKCRWQGIFLSCEQLFQKKYTKAGVCCVLNPSRLLNQSIPSIVRLDASKKIEMALNCFIPEGCQFFTKYPGEEWIRPIHLKPGFNYIAHIKFTVEDNEFENLLSHFCISSKGYSERTCLLKCVERLCGCSDPLYVVNKNDDPEYYLPPCRLKKISCLRTLGLKGNSTCNCLPPCKKVITKMILEASPITDIRITIDPFYSGLNASKIVIARLKINTQDSKLFSVIPTETWLTLLSSLGGIFNMFLGVGLFSCLEFMFFLFVKLPAALRHIY